MEEKGNKEGRLKRTRMRLRSLKSFVVQVSGIKRLKD